MTYGPLFDNDAVIQAGAKPSVVCDYVKPYIMVAVSSRVIPVSSRMVVFTSRVIAVSSRVIAVSSPIKLSVHKSARSVLSELSCLKLPQSYPNHFKRLSAFVGLHCILLVMFEKLLKVDTLFRIQFCGNS